MSYPGGSTCSQSAAENAIASTSHIALARHQNINATGSLHDNSVLKHDPFIWETRLRIERVNHDPNHSIYGMNSAKTVIAEHYSSSLPNCRVSCKVYMSAKKSKFPEANRSFITIPPSRCHSKDAPVVCSCLHPLRLPCPSCCQPTGCALHGVSSNHAHQPCTRICC